MNPNSSSAALLNVAVLIAVSALAYFVFPGQDGIMIAIGIVAGFVLASTCLCAGTVLFVGRADLRCGPISLAGPPPEADRFFCSST